MTHPIGRQPVVMWAIVAVLLSAAAATPSGQPRPLVVSSYAYPDRDRAAAIRPLADYLGRRRARAVDVRVLPSPLALVQSLARGETDVAVPNLYGYLRAIGAGGGVTGLPVPDVPSAQADRYRSVIVGRTATVADERALAGAASRLRLVLVSADSASGGFIPGERLAELGMPNLQASFAAVSFAGSHAAALAALAEGRADVGGLAADVFDAARLDGVRELWRSPPIPPGPLLCRTAADVPCAAIAADLLAADREAPSVMAGLRAGWPEFGDATRFVQPSAGQFTRWAAMLGPQPR